MRGFFDRLQARLVVFMQGRYGTDNLSNALAIVGFALMVLYLLFGWDVISIVALVLVTVAMVRSLSRNVARRSQENEKFLQIVAGPRRQFGLARKAFVNRKTTKYFKCTGCKTVLSVPRGKGTLRVVCPKCKTETMKKS